MAANEPKITKLKPGEGAGNFKRKQGPGTLKNKPGQENMRSRTPKGQRRTQNPAILSDGSVDPRSSQYQRGVAGREKLEDFVKRLDSQGVDERDIFMAAVKSLKNRGHGYVGAYLDSKNPNRRYNDVQAKAIADAVMTKAEVGNNPGARLTKGESDESKEARADRRAAAQESGAAPEAGRKAMPIRQQRREVVGKSRSKKGKIRNVRGRDKSSLGMPETWAKADTGVELNTPEAIEREKTGWKDFDPARTDLDWNPDTFKDTKETYERPEKAGPTRKEAAIKKEEEARQKGTSVTPTAVQKFQKSLKEKPEPTSDQKLKIDELMDKREEMDPEEWNKAFTQLMDDVKNGIGGQREELQKYMQDLRGRGTRKAAPLPGSAAAASRDQRIEESQAAKRKEQELRQMQAQAGREEARKRRQEQEEAEEERRIEKEIPVDEEGAPGEETESKPLANAVQITSMIKEQYRNIAKNQGKALSPSFVREQWNKGDKERGLFLNNLGAAIEILEDSKENGGENLRVDRSTLRGIIKQSFGFDPGPVGGEEPEREEAQGPETTTEQPQPPAQEKPPGEGGPRPPGQAPKRQPLPEEQIRGGRPSRTAPKGFGNQQALKDRKIQAMGQRLLSTLRKQNDMLKRMKNSPYAQKQDLIKNQLLPELIKELQAEGRIPQDPWQGESTKPPIDVTRGPAERPRPQGLLPPARPEAKPRGFGNQKAIRDRATKERGEKLLSDIQKQNAMGRRMDEAINRRGEQVLEDIQNENKRTRFNTSEYQEFAQSLRSLMR